MATLNVPSRPVIDLPVPERFNPENWSEATIIAHVRGWAHQSDDCRICQVEESSRKHGYDRGRSDGWVAGISYVATGIRE